MAAINYEFEPNPQEAERILLAAEDLRWLAALPRERLPTHTEIRLAASVLRRLFVDGGPGEIGAVGRIVTGHKKDHSNWEVTANSLDDVLNRMAPGLLWYALAGGAASLVPDACHAGLVMLRLSEPDPPQSEQIVGSPQRFSPTQNAEFGISSYLASTAIAVGLDDGSTLRISRKGIIKYIANRKGGVHFDPRRDFSNDTKPGRRQEKHEAEILDHGLMRLGHLSGPEYEILAMVHAVTDTVWARSLVKLGDEQMPWERALASNEMMFLDGDSRQDPPGWARRVL